MIILITGGASGLGEAITKKLLADQASTVYFTYHSSETNAKKIKADHPNAFYIKCDFANHSDMESLQAQIAALDIDVLINNAYSGSFIDSYFHKTSGEEFLNAFTKNILPVITVTRSAINCFRKKKSGKIITILTAALSSIPPIGTSVYVANKAYLSELVKVWAAENSKFNITSYAVSPGFMLTGFTKDVDERTVDQIAEQNPSKKLLTTGEVAEAVASLVHATRQTNGTNLLINSAADVV